MPGGTDVGRLRKHNLNSEHRIPSLRAPWWFYSKIRAWIYCIH